MALYDINGNEISGSGSVSGAVGLANLSDELVNKVLVVDENTQIINLLDVSKVVVGRYDSSNSFNQYYPAYRTSDYIPVKAGYTYVAQSWDGTGNTGYDRVTLFDENQNFVQSFSTAGNGTIRYVIFTTEINGYIRYTYTYSETANPMVFVGIATTDTYVAYDENTTEEEGTYEYKIAQTFKNMIQRDVEPSNIFGKTVYIIGDSNADNWANGEAEYLEKRYGCTVVGLAKYGATWATTGDETDTETSDAIGQYNAFVSAVGISEDEYLFPDDVALLFMMGTNGGNGTFDPTNEDVTTPGGAINYILKRTKYYGRNIPIGIFLPWCGSNNDQLAAAAEYYKIPYFDIPAMVIDDTPTNGLTRPDGTTVSNNYFTDGGNHLSAWGWEMFVRIAHPWIAHQI